MIFLDQYSQELFHNEFINELKKQMNSKESKIKIINNGEIDFIFLSKLIKKEYLPFEEIKDEIIPFLEKFDYLPLYYSYIINNQENLDDYISSTKVDISNKIEKFFIINDYKNILIQMNDIRVKIDEEIDKNFFEEYSHLIPFKYFYIETQYINNAPNDS